MPGLKGTMIEKIGDNMIVCVENPIELKKILELISNFSRFVGYKVNMQIFLQ